MTIAELLHHCSTHVIRDERGDVLDVRRERGATEKEIKGLERRIGVPLPSDFVDLLRFSNGMTLFRHSLWATNEMRFFREQRLLGFHDWGTERDIDCVALPGGDSPEGAIVFVNGDPRRSVAYADSISSWLEQVIEEVEQNRYWYCPGNYRKFNVDGVAMQVVETADQQGWRLSPPTIEELRRSSGL